MRVQSEVKVVLVITSFCLGEFKRIRNVYDLISHLKSVCGDKIPSDNSAVGQCVLLESLTSLVLPQGYFSPILLALGLPVDYKISMVNLYVYFWLSSLLIT